MGSLPTREEFTISVGHLDYLARTAGISSENQLVQFSRPGSSFREVC